MLHYIVIIVCYFVIMKTEKNVLFIICYNNSIGFVLLINSYNVGSRKYKEYLENGHLYEICNYVNGNRYYENRLS